MEFLTENLNLTFSILFAMVGLVLFAIAVYFLIMAIETKSWVSTEGIILVSDVIRNSLGSNSTGISYKPEICYSFLVGNKKYISNQIRSFINYYTSWSARAYKLTDKYPINSKITVYYNSVDPNESVLEPGIKVENIVFMMFGFLITVISLCFAKNYGLFELLG